MTFQSVQDWLLRALLFVLGSAVVVYLGTWLLHIIGLKPPV